MYEVEYQGFDFFRGALSVYYNPHLNILALGDDKAQIVLFETEVFVRDVHTKAYRNVVVKHGTDLGDKWIYIGKL